MITRKVQNSRTPQKTKIGLENSSVIWPFGNLHKGKPLNLIPISYLRWVVKESRISSNTLFVGSLLKSVRLELSTRTGISSKRNPTSYEEAQEDDLSTYSETSHKESSRSRGKIRKTQKRKIFPVVPFP